MQGIKDAIVGGLWKALGTIVASGVIAFGASYLAIQVSLASQNEKIATTVIRVDKIEERHIKEDALKLIEAEQKGKLIEQIATLTEAVSQLKTELREFRSERARK